MPVGYSSTPLARKLGIKEGFNVILSNQPSHFMDLFSDFPKQIKILKIKTAESADYIHLFCHSFSDLQKNIKSHKKALKKTGLMWISWPKATSNIATDLKRDMIREYLLDLGLVDVKVAAIDEDWSGLKFVYRLKDR